MRERSREIFRSFKEKEAGTKNLECTRKKMWYGPQSKEMEAKPYFDARILVIHMKITIL